MLEVGKSNHDFLILREKKTFMPYFNLLGNEFQKKMTLIFEPLVCSLHKFLRYYYHQNDELLYPILSPLKMNSPQKQTTQNYFIFEFTSKIIFTFAFTKMTN